MRAGRITASNFYSACHTSILTPAPTVLNNICYSYSNKTTTPSIDYGRSHEKPAISNYFKHMQPFHTDFEVKQCGWFLNEKYPCFGASPDGLIKCKCCGDGCLEIKCPSSAQGDNSINVPYLHMEGDEIRLSRKHKHCYQVQVQMFITDRDYCDFVCGVRKIIVERIVKDHELLADISVRAAEFHRKCVMPEMVFKFFSKKERIFQ